MYADFNVSEPEYPDCRTNPADRAGHMVALMLANNTRLAHEGEVETVEGEFNSETGNIAFRAVFPHARQLHGERRMSVTWFRDHLSPLPRALLYKPD